MTSPPERPADHEAADWFARLSAQTVSVRDLEAFRAWKADPANRRAYEALETMWSRAGRLRGDANLQAALAGARGRPRQRARLRRWALAGAAAVVALGLGVYGWASRPAAFVTDLGERRVIQLADGSAVHLDADSRVRVRLTGSARRVDLDRGRALFTVASDRKRPFTVEAGEARVTATGTRFTVRREAEGARVTLVEGGVLVQRRTEAWRLTPGQQIATEAARPRPSAVRAEAALRWTEGRLEFDRTPLAEAAAEINRYDRRAVRLAPGVDGRLEVTGLFNAGDAPAFAEAVARLYGLRVETDGAGGVTLAPPADKNS